MLMNDPEAGELYGRTIHDLEFHVLSEADQGWVLECTRRLVKEEGDLAAHMPEDQRQDRSFQFELALDGQLKDLGQGLPGRLPRFSGEAKELGESWQSEDTRPGDVATLITYHLAELEEKEGQLQALILSQASNTRQAGGKEIKVDVQGVATFAVAEGKLLQAKTQVNSTWPEGRVIQTALEMDPV